MDATVAGFRQSCLPADDDHPYRSGPWRPQEREWDAADLDVTGELPDDLEGIYLRNTENPVRPPIRRYHPFDGDGMIHSVAFRDGRASYRNRFVLTDGLVAEAEAGESLWAGLAESPRLAKRPDGWGARGRMKDASSTDVVVHAGVALSTFYQCGDVYQLDPLTLANCGKATWGGLFPSDVGVSAHARVDEHSGELMFFNYSTAAPFLHYGVLDRRRQVTHYVPIDLPGPRLPHDLAFTERFTVLPDLPLFWDPLLIDQGLYAARFHRDLPSRFAVVPRHGTQEDVRWFEAEPTYVLHWANAYEDGDEVVLEGFFQSNPEPADVGGAAPASAAALVSSGLPYGAAGPRGIVASGGPADRTFRFLAADVLGTRLHRWRFNLSTGSTREEDLSDRISEFGMVNGSRRGRRHRHVYATTNPPGWFLMDGIVRHDTLTGAVEEYRFPPGVFCSETAVAPRAGTARRAGSTGGAAGDRADDDDGYLVTIAIDVAQDRSYCAVFDASNVSDGPIATVALPERVSSGTHSFWAAAASIPGW